MKRPKTCIFCGVRGATSKEHFWPEWLASHLAPEGSGAYVTELHAGEGKQPQQLQRRSQRPGALKTKKIRAVCAACNNGWMSALESAAKLVMLPLVECSKTAISGPGLNTLALWVTLKSIVGEHAVEGTALTPPEDRRAFSENQVIPSYLRIYVALHSVRASTAYYRHSTTVATTRSGPNPALPHTIRRNIQAVTFLVGPLCFYVTSVRVNSLESAVLDPSPPMHRVWPSPAKDVELTSILHLTQSDLYSLSRSLERLVRHPRVKYGGPLPLPEGAPNAT